MSRSMKYLWVQTLTWTLVGLMMVIIFSMGATVDEWGNNANKTLILASLLLLGFSVDIVLRFMMGSKKYGVVNDERDVYIQRQALSVGFVLMMVYIFVLSIVLYSIYEEKGMMPVGWVWFIAYSSIVMANLFVGYLTLYYYRKQGM